MKRLLRSMNDLHLQRIMRRKRMPIGVPTLIVVLLLLLETMWDFVRCAGLSFVFFAKLNIMGETDAKQLFRLQ